MTVDMASIKEKIKKLLNVSEENNSAANEIAMAVRHAKKLMDAHNLTEDDLGSKEEKVQDIKSAKMAQQRVDIGGRFSEWELSLAWATCKIVGGVQFYLDRKKTYVRDDNDFIVTDAKGNPKRAVGYQFYGVAEDVMLAKQLFDELRVTILAMAKLRWGGAYRGDGRQYCEGFIRGINEAYREANQKEKDLAESSKRIGCGTALAVIDGRKEIVQAKRNHGSFWLRHHAGIRLRSGGSGSGSGYTDYSGQAYRNGVSDGRRANTSVNRSKKISG